MSPARAYVALGSNLGDRAAMLALGLEGLAALPETVLVGVSTVEETAPLGGLDQPWYLNQMTALDTALTPALLLTACLAIEQRAGRTRDERWAPRTLDLDIVDYGGLELVLPGLTLPHPGLADRDFWRRGIDELRNRGR
ncbi:MAG: 2-amino-4-hydroxy-6-hydroxymethyldihydropteridine diphosphokinase [Gemmatimonadales bacterium]|nr:2-amino-4-hydroxy-6-hydroxymethyldihydropteridine diphosphokinase [Gemmatimonadales bacterium]